MDNETRTTLILPPDLAALVDDYWHTQRLNTRNEAIRELLRRALDANSKQHIVTDDMVERIRKAQTGTKPAKENRR